jgi:hypothetical protein
MASIGEKPGETKGAPQDKERPSTKTEPSQSAQTEQLIVTLRVGSGEVLKVEKIDVAGKRTDLPKEETARLVGKESLDEIEAALDDAFEAGISSMLDPEDDDEESHEKETAEDMEIRKLLLGLVIGRAIRRRVRRRIVQRLILSRALSR